MGFWEYMNHFVSIEELYFVGFSILFLIFLFIIIWYSEKYEQALKTVYNKSKNGEELNKREQRLLESLMKK